MNIVIADHSVRVRAQLRTSLEELPGIEVVGEAANSAETIRFIQDLTPKIAIVNFQIPGGDGLSMIREIKVMTTSPVLLVLSNYVTPEYRSACLQAGADFFFDQSLEFEEVFETIKVLSQS